VPTVERLTVRTIGPDPRSSERLRAAHLLGFDRVADIEVSDLFYVVVGATDSNVRDALGRLIVDPLLQIGVWGPPPVAAGQVVETTLLPGVTDSVAGAVVDAARTMHLDVRSTVTGHRFVIRTNDGSSLADDELARLAGRVLFNAVIERAALGAIEPSSISTLDTSSTPGPLELVDVRGLDDEALAALNVSRAMALDPAELRAIADHFTALRRAPTDVELETLAQTWSEHCAHKTFRAAIVLADGAEVTPLLRQLRDSTDRIAAPFVKSAFVGNAGIISFAEGTTIAIKAETHNHPSAIEPFGGANTGVGGVIRDVMGAAHHPIACTDVLCFGPSDLSAHLVPAGSIHPRLVREGVVAGVADYGNKIGIPTVAGAVLYDPGYIANPLVFCGCVGVAPDDAPALTGPSIGDRVVLIGGRTGRDGLRGATFSSSTMDATTGDVAGASVQIGDPITEKLLIDLLREAPGLYSAITDCGAGGLSSSIGEMAETIGADVDISRVPLKYAGLAPWEIWLSEAQERMVLAVPPRSLEALADRAAHHGVELTDLGVFTGDGMLTVRHGATVVLCLDTHFLHEGRPGRTLTAVLPEPARDGATPEVSDPSAVLLRLLAHPNIASKEHIIRRYDHEILGSTLVRPLVGDEMDAPADGVVLVEPTASVGIAIGHGVNPWYGILDPERMAAAAVDEAIRNVVAVGADPDLVALMDNFSWGDPRRPTTFGDLVAAVGACCDAAEAHRAPFVSGKDSLNNEYHGSDGARHSVPPTLVITAVAHVPEPEQVVTPDLVRAGDILVVLGRTLPEFGGSHAGTVLATMPHGRVGTVPGPDPAAPSRYRRLHQALRTGRIAACHDVSEGGLAVALAEMAIGGRLGVEIDALPHPDPVVALFAESTGRFVCELDPADLGWFVEALGEPVHVLGRVVAEPALSIGPAVVSLEDAVSAFTGRGAPS
jgi:phosphoribosylformylglycinamidine synthase II